MSQNLEVLEEQEGTFENTSTTQRDGPRASLRQYSIASCSHLGALNMAMVWSWSSTALPSLRESTDALGFISNTDEAWIASITFLAGAVGSFATGNIAQKFGLRMSLIIASFPLLFGWLLIFWAPSLWAILLGRFVTGFFVSGVGASTSLMGELAHDSRRGRINFGFDLQFCVGVLAMYIIGTCVEWKAQALACAAVSVLFLVLLIIVVPESPRCLLVKGNETQAKKNLKYVRDSDDINAEFNEIVRSVETELKMSKTAREGGMVNMLIERFCSKEVMKPIFIATLLQFFLQVCGVVPIVCYAVDVFRAAGTEGVHENVSTIVLGVFNLLATCVASVFVDKQGRRRLFILSELILSVTLIVLGVFLMLKDSFGDNPFWNWFPLCCFVIYIIAYSFGVGPLPWVLMGEIFSPNAKGFSGGMVILAARIFGFLVMFFFNDMNVLIGQHGVYLFFATVCICGAVFVYFFVPETNGKSETEIQIEIQSFWFHHKNRSRRSQPNCNGNGIPLNSFSTGTVEDPELADEK